MDISSNEWQATGTTVFKLADGTDSRGRHVRENEFTIQVSGRPDADPSVVRMIALHIARLLNEGTV